ncbi:MAG: hypothetical protein M1817_002496 [Caeruleum heppii]|nr:MAG: hypothetical protein M1817_002496 [Caeruleum heppii]
MVQIIPAPDLRTLLPPLLACLPTAFVSHRAPPALLPLLTPILRQRVQLLSADASSSESWLWLLCWNPDKATELEEIIKHGEFEPHPVSGEIEYRQSGAIQYRRLDEETLQAQTTLEDLGITIVHLWCIRDEAGGGDGWRVSEVVPTDEPDDMDEAWSASMRAAEEAYLMSRATRGLQRADGRRTEFSGVQPQLVGRDEDEDADYWGQYDDTPGRTPGARRSPAPGMTPMTNGRQQAASDEEYYAQYGAVWPALDKDEPGVPQPAEAPVQRARSEKVNGLDEEEVDSEQSKMDHPRPNWSSWSRPEQMSSVSRLEEKADRQSQFETGIGQHVGSSIKSLARLARSAGIGREEFTRLVQRELEVLAFIDETAD